MKYSYYSRNLEEKNDNRVFVLCNSCFWCTSLLLSFANLVRENKLISRCFRCGSNNLFIKSIKKPTAFR
jgi:hypothetical protein